MRNTRHDEYNYNNNLPFMLNINIERTKYIFSKENNWHDDLELQLCTSGNGTVLIDGNTKEFTKNDIAVVLPNIIHYTGTNDQLNYTCLIIKNDFCKQMGINFKELQISPIIKSEKLITLMNLIIDCYSEKTISLRIPKLYDCVIKILIELIENHSQKIIKQQSKIEMLKNVKETIEYIQKNYSHKISLDIISKYVLKNKYDLCREFKKATGQTIIEYTNKYRCQKAANYIVKGYNVSTAAELCGFENHSFFSRTFKKHMGILPLEYKHQKRL